MTRPTDERLIALLRKIEALADFPELVEVVAIADELEAELKANREFAEKMLADQKSKVGRFFKERDYRVDMTDFSMPSASAPRPTVYIYRAVTACDERGQLRGWSFTRNHRGIVTIDISDRGGIFGAVGDEVSAEEFYSEAAALQRIIRPLLLGAS